MRPPLRLCFSFVPLDLSAAGDYHIAVTETLTVKTRTRIELVDITAQVRTAVQRARVDSGTCIVYVPHTTAAVTINENADPSVGRDVNHVLSRLAPAGAGYEHTEGNADAHAKAALVGSSATVLVEGGDLILGTWQGVFFCEFDGPRNRGVIVKVIADK
jgi:secondary thiamine-phosphate synthase enzyme